MLKELAQGINGITSIAYHLPGQAVRTWMAIPDQDRQAIINKLGLGDDMSQGYFFGNPQLFKMPAAFREMSPALTTSSVPLSADYMLAPGARLEIGPHGKPYETLGEVKEDTLTKALPFIVGGIVLVIGYNMFFRKGRR